MTVSVLYDIKPFSQRSLPHVNDSKTCSIQVPNYIKQKLEEKQKIDQEIKHANDILQNKNANIEAINEYLQLKEELDKHGISTQHINKLLNLLLNAKEYGFDSKKIVRNVMISSSLCSSMLQIQNGLLCNLSKDCVCCCC
jgi:hypothetical protein